MSMLARYASLAAPVDAPTFVALASNHAKAPSLVINKPTGTVEGDLMLAVLSAVDGAADASFASSGWSRLYAFDNGTDGGGAVLYKVAGASEGASYTFTNASDIIGSIVTYRNANVGVSTAYVTQTTTTVVVSGMTLPTAGCLFFAFYQNKDNAATFSTPSGMASVVSRAGAGAYNLFSEARGSGATGTRTSTVGGGSINSAGFSFFITPSSFSQPGPFPIAQATTQNPSNGTSLVINKPTGTREGDLMIAYLLGGGGTQASPGWSGDTGWTYAVNLTGGPGVNRPFNAIAYKVAGASEGASYTFTATTSRTLAGTIATYRNGAYDATGTQVSAVDPLVLTAVTATENYSRVVGIASRDAASITVIGPAGMSALVTQNDATAPSWVIEQDDALIGAISSGTRSFTVNSGVNVNGILHTVKPAASYTKYAQYIASNSNTAINGSSISVNTPAYVPGNLLLFVVCPTTAGNDTTISTPSGWTLLSGDSTGTNNTQPGMYVFYRVADGTEATSYSATSNVTTRLLAAIITLAGVDPETLTAGATNIGSSTTSITANAVTATANGILLYFGAFANDNKGVVTFTPPSGMTEVVDVSADGTSVDSSFEVAYQEGLSAGSTGNKTATASAAAGTNRYRALLVTVGAK